MQNYEIFLIRQCAPDNIEQIKRAVYPNVGRVYTAPDKNCILTAGTIYAKHDFREVIELREYDFAELESGDAPVFTARCVKGIEEIFKDMSRFGIYKSAVIAGMGAIVTLLAGCGLPEMPPHKLELQPGEAWLISMSTFLWQKGKVFEIVGRF
ncbi:MAG: hypothetical protein FWF94_00410 [Oscillospiraceae bacterium]|nr:hypothetical protein [Oscillospiraceae bacterium]